MTSRQHLISFRPIATSDMQFLRKLYATTRAEEMDMVPWSDKEKEDFLDLQFKAQHTFYQDSFKSADFHLLLLSKKKIGRLYVDERDNEIRIIDIAILPKYRGQGIGAQLMTDILKRGGKSNKPVSIHVEKNNPAMSLYIRLGFKEVEDQGVYLLMEAHQRLE